jgi:tight adherence protein B
MNMQTLALAFLAATAIGGVAWVFLYPLLSGERQAEKRRASVAKSEGGRRTNLERTSQKSRRDQVEQSLKEIDERRKKAAQLSINMRITLAGLAWSKQQFLLISAGLGVFAFLITLVTVGGLLPALGLGFGAGFGLPRWLLAYLKKRREKKFLLALPDAVDVIVRGIKAGLPLFDSIKMVAVDASEPLRGEFAAIVETQTVGMPLGEACARLYERMPLPEANFFGIVIAIQQKAGGNLSEALGNLSKVLRDRKKMAAKIQAMSMEAKASAAIIACLPIAVMILVWLTSPNYIELLWTHPTGRLMLAACLVWMTIGVLVMRKMINFDF